MTVQYKHTIVQLVILFSLVFFLLGMGGGDGNSSAEVNLPLPEKNFPVVLTDNQGVTTQTARMSWEGKNYLQGKYGNAKVTVPFAKIQQVRLFPGKDINPNAVLTEIKLKTGKTVQLAVDRTTKVYADTDFGQFEIFVKDLKSMDF
ncbi:MAG: hypothetical protein HQM14_10190 [SAR324 cluster bacterium]|nr:hypothetical protein [SAR324 cluster bacterium]